MTSVEGRPAYRPPLNANPVEAIAWPIVVPMRRHREAMEGAEEP